MDYPLETEILNERLIDGEEYEIMLNVDVEDPYSIAISRFEHTPKLKLRRFSLSTFRAEIISIIF